MDDSCASLAADDERAIRAWLDEIGESDRVTIRELMLRATIDPRARAYLLEQAAAARPDCLTCGGARAGRHCRWCRP